MADLYYYNYDHLVWDWMISLINCVIIYHLFDLTSSFNPLIDQIHIRYSGWLLSIESFKIYFS
jgi:hypothetical protein